MARYALIDGYLETVRSRIRWRSDLDDIVAEMEDHLYSTTEGFCARGFDLVAAQRATLDRFGDPRTVQEAFASTQRGGIAMPTPFTIRAGRIALAGAVAWLAATVLLALSTWFDPDGWLPLYLAIVAAVTIGGVLGLVAMVALGQRLGGIGTLGMIGLVVAAVGVLASFAVTWALPLWMTIEGVGLLLVAWSVRRSPEVPQLGLVAIGTGFLVGTIVFTIANMLQVGWRDSWGDYPLAWFVGAAVGIVIVAVGLALVGGWLAGEEPADAGATPIAA